MLPDRTGYARTDTIIGGWRVIIMPDIPLPPAEEAKRIVRHTFGKDFMEWVGLPMGPSPDATTAYYSNRSNTLYVTQVVFEKLEAYRKSGVHFNVPALPEGINQWYRSAYPREFREDSPDVFSL